jgi:hypothetical protein
LIDARADIGAFNRFSKKKAADTIKVKVNRSSPFDPKTLGFAFDNDTLGGIDTDKNGISDRVDFILRSRFSALEASSLNNLRKIAELSQSILIAADPASARGSIEQYISLSTCLLRLDEAFELYIEEIDFFTFDTTKRSQKERSIEDALFSSGEFPENDGQPFCD